MNYTKGEIVLLKYSFTSFEVRKVRPAVVVSGHCNKYEDIFIVPLTSRTYLLQEGEFLLKSWKEAGLNVSSAVKRGCYLIDKKIVLKKLKKSNDRDIKRIDNSLKKWLELE